MTEDMALSGAWATDTPSPPRRAKDKAGAHEWLFAESDPHLCRNPLRDD